MSGQFVYFIQAANGPVKIGIADNVPERLKALQTANPFELTCLAMVEGGRDVERAYHRKFKRHRLRGEWFVPASELLREIAGFEQYPTADRYALEYRAQQIAAAKAKPWPSQSDVHRIEFVVDVDWSDPSEDGEDALGAMVWCSACCCVHFSYVPRNAILYGFEPFESRREFKRGDGWLLDWKPE